MQEERIEATNMLDAEVGGLKGQLKSHVDSIRILVDEKTSLEKNVQLSLKRNEEKEGMYNVFVLTFFGACK